MYDCTIVAGRKRRRQAVAGENEHHAVLKYRVGNGGIPAKDFDAWWNENAKNPAPTDGGDTVARPVQTDEKATPGRKGRPKGAARKPTGSDVTYGRPWTPSPEQAKDMGIDMAIDSVGGTVTFGGTFEYGIDVTRTFLKRMKEARRLAGLTQERLASIVGVSKYTVSEWESGRSVPGLKVLGKVCAACHVSPNYLMGFHTNFGQEQLVQLIINVGFAPDDANPVSGNVLHTGLTSAPPEKLIKAIDILLKAVLRKYRGSGMTHGEAISTLAPKLKRALTEK
jgi:transcriptional regulator with XRE-family HTH domain